VCVLCVVCVYVSNCLWSRNLNNERPGPELGCYVTEKTDNIKCKIGLK